eukprot:3557626-Amphidinium_carterae.1
MPSILRALGICSGIERFMLIWQIAGEMCMEEGRFLTSEKGCFGPSSSCKSWPSCSLSEAKKNGAQLPRSSQKSGLWHYLVNWSRLEREHEPCILNFQRGTKDLYDLWSGLGSAKQT